MAFVGAGRLLAPRPAQSELGKFTTIHTVRAASSSMIGLHLPLPQGARKRSNLAVRQLRWTQTRGNKLPLSIK
jgi:hypothetical protein